MKLIIDIPEELHRGIECRNPELETEYVCDKLMKAVDNGTPLDDVKEIMEKQIEMALESLKAEEEQMETLISSIITGIVAITTCLITQGMSNSKTRALIEYRLMELEKKQRK